jgi:hypothetical protein
MFGAYRSRLRCRKSNGKWEDGNAPKRLTPSPPSQVAKIPRVFSKTDEYAMLDVALRGCWQTLPRISGCDQASRLVEDAHQQGGREQACDVPSRSYEPACRERFAPDRTGSRMTDSELMILRVNTQFGSD